MNGSQGPQLIMSFSFVIAIPGCGKKFSTYLKAIICRQFSLLNQSNHRESFLIKEKNYDSRIVERIILFRFIIQVLFLTVISVSVLVNQISMPQLR
jgi:hypothetical protein